MGCGFDLGQCLVAWEPSADEEGEEPSGGVGGEELGRKGRGGGAT